MSTKTKSLNRVEALNFIRDNSRCVCSMLANPASKAEAKEEWYNAIYFEQRIGNNGNVFILQDCGKRGWDIYFNGGSNNVDKSIAEFCEATGADILTACHGPEKIAGPGK